ncbi:hypothetical protein CPC08DRAFT_768782 [Agrocybe pediades]|nr:hypothetical protein CPC08DRAFT_768782 [Agrocybe pediades]
MSIKAGASAYSQQALARLLVLATGFLANGATFVLSRGDSTPLASDLEAPPLSVPALLKFNATLLKRIRSCDRPFLYPVPLPAVSSSRLHALSVPPLVNYPDGNRWALIHHCAAVDQPSIDMLDALCRASAGIAHSVYRRVHTLLHVLVRSAKPDIEMSGDATYSLKTFTLHLNRELQATLGGWDKANETCIHDAAEHEYRLNC